MKGAKTGLTGFFRINRKKGYQQAVLNILKNPVNPVFAGLPSPTSLTPEKPFA